MSTDYDDGLTEPIARIVRPTHAHEAALRLHHHLTLVPRMVLVDPSGGVHLQPWWHRLSPRHGTWMLGTYTARVTVDALEADLLDEYARRGTREDWAARYGTRRGSPRRAGARARVTPVHQNALREALDALEDLGLTLEPGELREAAQGYVFDAGTASALALLHKLARHQQASAHGARRSDVL